jgi:hypothetical protein
VKGVAAALADEVEDPLEDPGDDVDADTTEDTEDPVTEPEDVSWRFGNPAEDTVAVTPALVELRLLDTVKVGTGTVDGLPWEDAGGISAGHRLHSPRGASQYASTMNLRKPTASKFEKHFWKDLSSYWPLLKQAALSDTKGIVWKLIGTRIPISRWAYRER